MKTVVGLPNQITLQNTGFFNFPVPFICQYALRVSKTQIYWAMFLKNIQQLNFISEDPIMGQVCYRKCFRKCSTDMLQTTSMTRGVRGLTGPPSYLGAR